jgi:RHS repeat-associated protein
MRFIGMKNRNVILRTTWLCIAALQLWWLPQLAQAKYIGADPPKCPACSRVAGCAACSRPSVAERSDTSSSVSRTEGNLSEWIGISTIRSAFEATLDLSLIYNSYNADGSRATVDSVMGYGWNHSYNTFLFSQLGSMFRYGADGRVTRYVLGAGGLYTAATGYFETLVASGSSFILTQKDQTVYTFGPVPGTTFQVGGPVWRLTSMVDRNGNAITFAYSGGNLSTATDTYGRSLTFKYNSQSHLTSVTDPYARVTTFQYDATGHLLTGVTDPNGNTVKYAYNALYQLTTKTDKAGRTFIYSYSASEPVSVNDSANSSPATLSNSGNWATNPTSLAQNQLRVYTPATTTNTDGRGNKWTYQYDANGYLLRTIAPDASTTTYTYDPATLQLAAMTDADGHTTAYTYDAMGNMLSMTDALGHVTTYTYDPTFNQMTRMTDPRGRVTTYTIDPANGNRTQETDPLGQTNKWTYDSHGNVLTSTDKNGNTTTYLYDAFGDRIQTADPLGNITRMTYDAVGNMLSLTDADGHTTTYKYDGMNRLIDQTDPTGHTDQTFYDGEGNRIQFIDRDGHSTGYQYDLRQRLLKTTDALNHSDTFTYDGDDNRLTWMDRDGHTTTYAYDVQNRMNKLTDALGDVITTTYDPVSNVLTQTDADSHTTTYAYDALNRRITMTDALGEQTQYYYDTGTFTGPIKGISCIQCGATPGSSLVTEQIDPDGTAGIHAGVTYLKYDALDRLVITVRKTGCLGAGCPDTITSTDAVTTNAYDAVGNRLIWTEPDGNAITYQYDADNRLIRETNAAGDITLTAYDGVGNVITLTAPNLNATTNTYDSLNRLIQATDSEGLVGTATYDPVGNKLTATDGNGHTTTYGYDALNRLVTETDPLGKTGATAYDAVGNVLTSTDRNGNVTSYTYDAINRRISVKDALGNITQSTYDPVGNLTKLTDANSHATQYTYDAVNRPLKEIYADSLSRSFTYDPAGNLVARTDQIGQTTNYGYSDLYFLISRTYPSAVNDAFTYDLSGRMLTGQRGSWPVTFGYDGADRLIHTVQNGATIAYVYDIPGRTRQITYPGGRVLTEHTDFRTRMDHINDAAYAQPIVQYSYDLANNALARNYRNGATSAFTYNANNWTTNIAHNNPSIFTQFGYAYDNEGNKQFENKTPQTPAQSEAYQYDATYRLIDYKVGALVGSTVPAPSTQTAYSLDPVGNWKSKTTNAVTQTRTYNADNELTAINAQNVTYDNDGNTLNDGAYLYAHDEENRLTGVTRIAGSTVIAQYEYDALSRRVRKIADPAGTASTTLYFYDSRRIVEEQNSLGVTSATYAYGNYVDEVLTMDLGGNTYYYHQNALGSVEAVTDSTAAPVERYSYDAYGFVTVTDGAGSPVPQNAWGTPHSAIGNPWMFTAQRLDEETGIYFYRARYYDSVKGRFLERDPVEYGDGMNLYEYADDNPVGWTDPSGELIKPLPAADCAKAMQARKDKIAGLQKGDRSDVGDCAGPDCEKVTYLVELPHSCEGDVLWAKVGHTGIGVGNAYFDYGPGEGVEGAFKPVPGARWWARDKDKLSDVLKDIKAVSGGDEDVLKIEQCVCQAQAASVKKYWADLYKQIDDKKAKYCIPGLHCTSAALNSTQPVIESVAKSILKTEKIEEGMFNGVSPEAALGILTKLSHLCGSNKGKMVKVDQIQTEKKP